MNSFETSTVVGPGGEIRVAGVPFQPGAEVAVVISSKSGEATETSGADGDRAKRLMSALDHGHNTAPIGPLNRDELYDRRDVR